MDRWSDLKKKLSYLSLVNISTTCRIDCEQRKSITFIISFKSITKKKKKQHSNWCIYFYILERNRSHSYISLLKTAPAQQVQVPQKMSYAAFIVKLCKDNYQCHNLEFQQFIVIATIGFIRTTLLNCIRLEIVFGARHSEHNFFYKCHCNANSACLSS